MANETTDIQLNKEKTSLSGEPAHLTETPSLQKISNSSRKKKSNFSKKRNTNKTDELDNDDEENEETDPEDPDDGDDNGETDPEDPDDDDDGETDPEDPDDDAEDENELKQGEEKKQIKTPFKLPFHFEYNKSPENKKIHPQDPQKVKRSPFQQILDALFHGVKGAQIKNGELPLKTSIADSLLAGLGFKSYKKDILIQEQAQKFWSKKLSGHGEDASLLNIDLADKKLKKQEGFSSKNTKEMQSNIKQETLIKQEAQNQFPQQEQKPVKQNLLSKDTQEENLLKQTKTGTNSESKESSNEKTKTSFEKEPAYSQKYTNDSQNVSLKEQTDDLLNKQAKEHILAQQQQHIMEQNQEAQRQMMATTLNPTHFPRPPHLEHPQHHLRHPPLHHSGQTPANRIVETETKLVSMAKSRENETPHFQNHIHSNQPNIHSAQKDSGSTSPSLNDSGHTNPTQSNNSGTIQRLGELGEVVSHESANSQTPSTMKQMENSK